MQVLSVENSVIESLTASIKLLKLDNERLKLEVTQTSAESLEWQEKYSEEREKYQNYMKRQRKWFGDAQIRIFQGEKMPNWDSETLKKTFLLKVNAGDRILNMLRNLFLPLPSPATIRRYLAEIPFSPGVQNLSLSILKEELEAYEVPPCDRRVMLGWDEKSIVPGIQHDPSTGTEIGYATLESTQNQLAKNPHQIASHGLVFLASLLSSNPRLKHIVDYEYTTNATDGKAMKDKIIEVIKKIEEIGKVRVECVCMDLSPDNISALKQLGVTFEANSPYKFPHPVDANRVVYVFPDIIHCIKNLTNAFRKYTVTFTDSFAEQHNLSSSVARFEDIETIFEAENTSMKFAPKLINSVLYPDHFEKMNEETAYELISDDVSTALEIYFEDPTGSLNPTAFLVKHLNKLQKTFNSTIPWSSNGESSYDTDIKYLEFFRDELLGNLEFNLKRGKLKCIEGTRKSISSLIELSKYLFDTGVDQVLPKNFNNNPVENIFSQLTYKTAKPDSLQFRQSLKSTHISDRIQHVRGSYRFNEKESVSNKVDIISMAKAQNANEEEDSNEIEIIRVFIPDTITAKDLYPEKLHRMAFYKNLIKLIQNNSKCVESCEVCRSSLSLSENEDLKVTDEALTFFSFLELIFRKLKEIILLSSDSFKESFLHNATNIPVLRHCFNIHTKLSLQYFKFRFSSYMSEREKHRINKYSSKTLSK